MIQIILGWSVAALSIAAAGDTRIAGEASRGNVERVRSLVAEQADVNAAQGDGMTALHWAAFRDGLEMARLLIEAKANVEPVTRIDAVTPLILASRNGSPAMVDLLLEAGADPSKPTASGASPLMAA
ncbi:MAG: ankyrin repeat domain-containing protein, partial [Vicinamibacteria bacterium]